MRIADNSWYNPDILVQNAILEITPPGKDCPVAFYVEENFNTVFNSSLLDISKAKNYNQLKDLPEGIYKIKYSIKPNNILYEEYTLLRNYKQLEDYYKAICSLYSSRNKISKKEFVNKRKELIWIKEIIDAAKYHVEECDKEEEGLELYNEANELLDRYNAGYCVHCN